MIPFIEKAERYILNHFDSASTMLVFMGIIGTITSSFAQQLAIKNNKKLSDETKSFLINQEENDCILSAGLTWLTGTGSKKIIHHLTSNGYLLNDKVRSASDEVASTLGMTHRELAKSGFYKNIKGQFNIFNKELDFRPIRTDFLRCQEGLSVIAAIGAAILTTNLIVPILRNKFARPRKPKTETATLTNYVIQKPSAKLQTYNHLYSNSNMRV